MPIVRWEPGAKGDLRRYRHWLRREAGNAFAEAWIDALLIWVDELQEFPERGTPRDDLAQNVRTRIFKKAVTIAYVVRHERVSILHLYGRGRDITAADFADPE